VSKIRKLIQGSRSASSYSTEFNQLSFDLKWDNRALLDQFKYGLNEEIKDMLMHFPDPETLSELSILAIRCDNRIFERKCEKNHFPSNYNEKRFNQHPKYERRMESDNYNKKEFNQHEKFNQHPKYEHNKVAASSPTPMEVDFGTLRSGPLTDDEKKHRRDNNLCMYCGKPNHKRFDCPALKKRDFHLISGNESRR
jgi:hypothetical protein